MVKLCVNAGAGSSLPCESETEREREGERFFSSKAMATTLLRPAASSPLAASSLRLRALRPLAPALRCCTPPKRASRLACGARVVAMAGELIARAAPVSTRESQRYGATPGLRRLQRRVVARAGNDEPGGAEVDVSIFRFTLGIPGFDDADLPRLVGILFGSLLLVNHVVSIQSMTNAQLTSEALGLFLAAVACSLPSVGRRLKGGEAGKEVNKEPGRRSLFELAQRLSNKQKQELAWGSFALFQNTKTSAVIVWHRGEVVCARGSWDLDKGAKSLTQLQEMLNQTTVIRSSDPIYVSDGADTKGWPIVPKDAKSTLVQPFEGEKGGLILFSYQPRSYSSKDRTWVAMMTQKISQALKT